MFPLREPLADALRQALHTEDDLTAQLLASRGVTTAEAAQAFLSPSYDDHLYDPLLMTDMPKAAERLARAIATHERIVVWSDYDCDGIPGAVLLHDFLAKAGANFTNYIPHRHLEGYGVNIAGIEKLAGEGTSLIVTVDSGITDLEAVARAQELGIDVIVTDHHLPKETLPEAYAVVNPNAREDERYPFRALCGSGVAWKLVCATLPRLRSEQVARGEEPIPEGWEKWLLDMVGLATIADMVSLTGENRVLATYGLLVMRKSPRLGLQKLCSVIRTNQRTITEDDVGFMIAPRINAASRMGDARDAFELFTTDNAARAETLAKGLDAANRKRKAEAGAITRAVHERLAGRPTPPVIALGDPEWRPALLGLVANTIADEYERPVLLWGREGTDTNKGSIRSGGFVHALTLMEAAGDTFEQFGGHAAAGGFALAPAAVFDFESRMAAALERALADTATNTARDTAADALLTTSEISLRYLQSIERLAPFGIDNPKPVFSIPEAEVMSVTSFGKAKEHLKLIIAGPREVSGIVFFAKGALAQSLTSLDPGDRVHLLAHLERDTFSRGNPIRLRLLNLKKI